MQRAPIDPDRPGEGRLTDARRILAHHRRRRYPDNGVCGFCAGRWRADRTLTGKPAHGCAPRRRALAVLDAAGQLDDQGRLR
ncbi:hypothetical protein R8Z50_03815 [Longispora sp. K20-0274]|uniref:hypothetical protein n=1 Tax=Longispora sp. K20-0274 TaxID=3088255 RepID=UPI00399A757E